MAKPAILNVCKSKGHSQGKSKERPTHMRAKLVQQYKRMGGK